jgi:methylated-DNA-[protein]-cysteine S-methyltransferase
MNSKGTKFQLKVWKYLEKIPKGKVKTYLEVAKGIGKPKAFRAVANAVGKNPYPPKIPCHRVIRSDGTLGGYSAKGVFFNLHCLQIQMTPWLQLPWLDTVTEQQTQIFM